MKHLIVKITGLLLCVALALSLTVSLAAAPAASIGNNVAVTDTSDSNDSNISATTSMNEQPSASSSVASSETSTPGTSSIPSSSSSGSSASLPSESTSVDVSSSTSEISDRDDASVEALPEVDSPVDEDKKGEGYDELTEEQKAQGYIGIVEGKPYFSEDAVPEWYKNPESMTYDEFNQMMLDNAFWMQKGMGWMIRSYPQTITGAPTANVLPSDLQIKMPRAAGYVSPDNVNPAAGKIGYSGSWGYTAGYFYTGYMSNLDLDSTREIFRRPSGNYYWQARPDVGGNADPWAYSGVDTPYRNYTAKSTAHWTYLPNNAWYRTYTRDVQDPYFGNTIFYNFEYTSPAWIFQDTGMAGDNNPSFNTGVPPGEISGGTTSAYIAGSASFTEASKFFDDTAPPVPSIYMSGGRNSAEWTNAGATVTLTSNGDSGRWVSRVPAPGEVATDIYGVNTGSGFNHFEYVITDSAAYPYSGWQYGGKDATSINVPVTLPAGQAGVRYLHVQTVDYSQNYNYFNKAVYLDNLAPTNPTVTGYSAGWSKNNAVLSLGGGADGHSGVQYCQYSLDGGAWQNYTGSTSVTVSGSGAHSISVRAVDNAGNVSAPAAHYFSLDQTPPTVPTISGVPGSWTKNSVSVAISGSTDAHSGLARYEYSINGSAWQTYSSAISLTGTGTYTINSRAVDNVGNISGSSTATARIDKVNPSMLITQSPVAWTKGDVSINVSTSDTDSGVAKIDKPDSTSSTNSNLAYIVSKNGTYNFTVWDVAGNSTTLAHTVKNIDKNDPSNPGEGGGGPGDKDGPAWGIITQDPTTWTNGEVELTLETGDKGSGIRSITYPDGQKEEYVTGAVTPPATGEGEKTVTFTATQNGTYEFVVEDVAGNISTYSHEVKNVDTTKPTGTVTAKPMTWTNGDVVLSLATEDSESGIRVITLPDGKKVELSQGSLVPPATGESGKTLDFTVTKNGTYKFIVEDVAGNLAEISYEVKNIDKNDPSNPGEGGGGPGDKDGPAWGIITQDPTIWTNGEVELTLETGDKGSGIRSITYPDGQKEEYVTGAVTPPATGEVEKKVTFTVTQNDAYAFVVEDVAGNISKYSHVVKNIDTAKPTGMVTAKPMTWTNGNVVLTLATEDSESGIRVITLPDGQKVELSQGNLVPPATGEAEKIVDFTVTKNGTYKFAVEDVAGNIAEISHEVKNIDTIKPTGAVTAKPMTWTNGDVVLTLATEDKESGIRVITLPDGKKVELSKGGLVPPSTGEAEKALDFTVTKNGTYKFSVEDVAGNIAEIPYEVKNIDKNDPSNPGEGGGGPGDKDGPAWGIITQDPTIWTNQDVKLTLEAGDKGSGIRIITLPDGSTVDSGRANLVPPDAGAAEQTASCMVPQNGTYKFIVEDMAGNVSEYSHTVTNIDKVNPAGVGSYAPTGWTNQNVRITMNATDDASGVRAIVNPSGRESAGSSTTYTVEGNGTYPFRVWDVAGNSTTVPVVIGNIDKIPPRGTDEQKKEDGKTKVTIDAGDDESGVDYIILPDGTIVPGNKAEFEVTKSGKYTYIVVDKAGNRTEITVDVGVNPTATPPPATSNPKAPVPKGAGVMTTVLDDMLVPLGNFFALRADRLTLVDLACTIIVVIFSIITFFKSKKRDDYAEGMEKEENSPERVKSNRRRRILNIVMAVLAVLLFFITQPLIWKFQIIDVWSLVFLAMTIISGYWLLNKKRDKDREKTKTMKEGVGVEHW